MKLYLIFLVIISLMIVPMIAGTVTMGLNQTVSINVNEGAFVDITPDNLDFGLVVPSQTPSVGPDVKFDVTGSNINLTISSNVTGDSIFNGISFIDKSTDPFNITQIDKFSVVLTTTDQVKTFGTQILVPLGTSLGTKEGTITYTVTGPAP